KRAGSLHSTSANILKDSSVHASYSSIANEATDPIPRQPPKILSKSYNQTQYAGEPKSGSTEDQSYLTSTDELRKKGQHKSGKLRLQGLLSKKEEFDEDGNKATDREWKDFWFVLDGATLIIAAYDKNCHLEVRPLPKPLATNLLGPTPSADIAKRRSSFQKMKGGSMFDLRVDEKQVKKVLEEESPRLSIARSLKSPSKEKLGSFLNLFAKEKTPDPKKDKAKPGKAKTPSGSKNVAKQEVQTLKSCTEGSPRQRRRANTDRENSTGSKSSLYSLNTVSSSHISSEDKLAAISSCEGLIEQFALDQYCRVNVASEHKKPVFRAMLSKNRSFLLRAANESEMELWVQAIRTAIDLFKTGNI
ncbi:hypothetical protein HDU91_000520, partial [Kappamyces sp. JEL0680]